MFIADIYIYSEPVHNLSYYSAWVWYYIQHFQMPGFINLYLWFKIHQSVKAFKPLIHQHEGVVMFKGF